MTNVAGKSQATTWLPWLLGLVALVLYFFSRSLDVDAGVSAQVVNTVGGLYYIPVTTHYLYISVARLFAWLPGTLISNLALMSAVFGALCVALLFSLMRYAPLYDKLGTEVSVPVHKRARIFAAWVAGLALIPVLPFWQVATGPQSLAFDVFLLLLAFSLLLRYGRDDSGKGWLYASVFILGLGITEYSMLLAFAPLYILLCLYLVFRRGQFSAALLWTLLGLGLLGLLFYALPVWAVSRTPDYGYGEYSGPWTVLLDLWRKQFRELKAGFPTFGGLLIILTTLAPWAYVLFVPKPRLNGSSGYQPVTLSMLFLLNLLGGVLLLELGFSPLQIMGATSSIALPYLLVASWLGYLAGYWLLKAQLPDNPFARNPLKYVWGLLALLNLGLPVAAAVRNYEALGSSRLFEVADYARNLVDSCGDRRYYLSNGSSIDDVIRYVADEKGKALEIFSGHELSRGSVQRYFAGQLQHPELATTNVLTTSEFLKMAIKARGLGDFAFQHPDMVLSLGYQSVPNGLAVFAVEDLRKVDAAKLFQANDQLLSSPAFAKQIEQSQGATNTPVSLYLLKEYSRNVNNLGIALRMLSRDDLAEQAFARALEIMPQNPSALMNLRALYLKKAEGLGRDSRSVGMASEEALSGVSALPGRDATPFASEKEMATPGRDATPLASEKEMATSGRDATPLASEKAAASPDRIGTLPADSLSLGGSKTDQELAEDLRAKAKDLLDRAHTEAQRLGPVFQNPILLGSQYGYLYSESLSLMIAEQSRRVGMGDLEAGALEQAKLINPESLNVKTTEALFSFGQGDLEQAAQQYRQVLAKDPRNMNARIGLAAVAYTRGELTAAIDTLESSEWSTQDPVGQSFLSLLYLDNNQADRGLALYEQAATGTNQAAASAAFLSLAAYRLNKLNEAEKYAQIALISAPNNLPILLVLANVAERKKNPEQLADRLEAILKVDPKNIGVLERLTRVRMQLRQNSRAREAALAMIDLVPDNAVANLALASLSEIPEMQEKYLRRALSNKQSPLYHTVANNLAYALIAQAKYAEAAPLAEEAVTRLPDNDKYRHTLAEAYLGIKQYDKAEEHILVASTLAPADANHQLIYGEILMAKGDHAKAKDLITQALPLLQGSWRSRALKDLELLKNVR